MCVLGGYLPNEVICTLIVIGDFVNGQHPCQGWTPKIIFNQTLWYGREKITSVWIFVRTEFRILFTINREVAPYFNFYLKLKNSIFRLIKIFFNFQSPFLHVLTSPGSVLQMSIKNNNKFAKISALGIAQISAP